MAWTQADIDRLKKAMASGVKQTMEGGRMVTFDTFEAMQNRLAMMEAEVSRRPASFSRKARYVSE
ncbi:hypothetical protein HFO84_00040 [Rhizobium leguminosarum]|uniref:phage head-tail joining protein n=1 Tax=Rhizobium leguminosarum TaxID=384 RepID=UPI001C9569F5|nr:hypothetical protein [Rhizobium leguminosarum]MBY5475720.1 hypothetical protein [Rhizobium leguminosarum]